MGLQARVERDLSINPATAWIIHLGTTFCDLQSILFSLVSLQQHLKSTEKKMDPVILYNLGNFTYQSRILTGGEREVVPGWNPSLNGTMGKLL